ncbi:MAG TPA: efflux RND transporter periplasmic adaptor subunit [Steroidobacteraceae bacterium]|jgi:membrane fusion protein (multidrug efflux system)
MAAGVALVAMACSRTKQSQQTAGPPAQVGVITAHAGPIPLTRDLVGRLSATRVSDVRARVAGILLKRLYQEGTDVKQGQALFQIDPAPLKAALDAATAALAQAQATSINAHVAAQRARELLPGGLVSRSDLDNAAATERSTAAAVQQAEANVETARINLGYARVTAPIAGRAGQQAVTEGALVGQGTPTLLTTVEQLDPIYANFDQPAVEVERLRRAQTSGHITLVQPNKAAVQLTLPDGAPYGHPGLLDFSDVTVDPTTGAVALRALIPNPDEQLLPGMYVNIRLTLGTLNHAYLVPMAALQRDNEGPYVLTVGANDKVVQKRVASDTSRAQSWIVTAGLTDGDRIIVTGIPNARTGETVVALPYAPQNEAAANGNEEPAAAQP